MWGKRNSWYRAQQADRAKTMFKSSVAEYGDHRIVKDLIYGRHRTSSGVALLVTRNPDSIILATPTQDPRTTEFLAGALDAKTASQTHVHPRRDRGVAYRFVLPQFEVLGLRDPWRFLNTPEYYTASWAPEEPLSMHATLTVPRNVSLLLDVSFVATAAQCFASKDNVSLFWPGQPCPFVNLADRANKDPRECAQYLADLFDNVVLTHLLKIYGRRPAFAYPPCPHYCLRAACGGEQAYFVDVADALRDPKTQTFSLSRAWDALNVSLLVGAANWFVAFIFAHFKISLVRRPYVKMLAPSTGMRPAFLKRYLEACFSSSKGPHVLEVGFETCCGPVLFKDPALQILKMSSMRALVRKKAKQEVSRIEASPPALPRAAVHVVSMVEDCTVELKDAASAGSSAPMVFSRCVVTLDIAGEAVEVELRATAKPTETYIEVRRQGRHPKHTFLSGSYQNVRDTLLKRTGDLLQAATREPELAEVEESA